MGNITTIIGSIISRTFISFRSLLIKTKVSFQIFYFYPVGKTAK